MPHLAAEQHVKGNAEFVGDIPVPSGCLHAAYAMSKRAHAKIVSINKKPALEIPGVHAVMIASDIPGINMLGCIACDEEVLASKEVVYYGQPVAVVVADSNRIAQMAALQVQLSVMLVRNPNFR